MKLCHDNLIDADLMKRMFSHMFADTVCPVLEDPEFGSVSYEGGGRRIGSDAAYTCDPRYSLVGDAVRTCMENGEWSGEPPTCECMCYTNTITEEPL